MLNAAYYIFISYTDVSLHSYFSDAVALLHNYNNHKLLFYVLGNAIGDIFYSDDGCLKKEPFWVKKKSIIIKC